MRKILSGETARFLRYVSFLFLVGMAFVILSITELWSWAGAWQQPIKGIVNVIGSSFIVSSLVIIVLDLGFRKEFIDDVEKIFEKSQNQLGVNAFALERKGFDELLVGDFKAARRGVQIRIVGVSQKSFFTDTPGIESIIEKVTSGVHLKVLVFDPNSIIVGSYQALSREFGSPDLKKSLLLAQEGHIRETYIRLTGKKEQIKGSFEVRLINDVFSTIYLYIGHEIIIFGIYLADRRGTLGPAFVIQELQLSRALEGHFERLWKHTESNIIYKIDNNETIDNSPVV